MEDKIKTLSSEFNRVVLTRSDIVAQLIIVKSRVDKLASLHRDYVQNNKTPFGLDTFRFQSKILEIDSLDTNSLFVVVCNRIYCEYFKLYKIVISYISDCVKIDGIDDVTKQYQFPIYKDLEPHKEYEFDIIVILHKHILDLLSLIVHKIRTRETELVTHQTMLDMGLNIDNFISTMKHDILLMREQTELFISYCQFFNTIHVKYLQRMYNKVQRLNDQINEDVNFDDLSAKDIEVATSEKTSQDEQLVSAEQDVLNTDIPVEEMTSL